MTADNRSRYPITTQADVRRSFWACYPDASRRRTRDGDYTTDTRVLFVGYVDTLCRDGQISEALARRVTL